MLLKELTIFILCKRTNMLLDNGNGLCDLSVDCLLVNVDIALIENMNWKRDRSKKYILVERLEHYDLILQRRG